MSHPVPPARGAGGIGSSRASLIDRHRRRTGMRLPMLMAITISAAAPLTVINGGATYGWAVSGIVGIPLAYLVTGVLLLVFAEGLVALAREIPAASAFYAYVSHSLGRIPGLGAALIALVAYNLMQVGLFGALGPAAAEFAAGYFGLETSWVVWALVAWAVVAVFGVARIEITGRAMIIMVAGEIIVAAVFAAVNLAHPAGGHTDLAAISPGQLVAAGFVVTLVVTIAGFVGFEQGPLMSDEVRDATIVPRSVRGTILVTTVLYTVCALAMTVAAGPGNVVARAVAEGPQLVVNLAGAYLPYWFVWLGQLMYVTSVFAGLLAFHNTSNRYLVPLGREGVLPPVLAKTSLRAHSPWVASVTQSAIGLAVIVLYHYMGWDPGIYMLFWLTVIAGFGVLVLMVLTAVAAFVYFFDPARRRRAGVWRGLVAPGVAVVTLGAVMVATVVNVPVLFGLAPDDPRQWILPAVFGITFAIGCAWAAVLRRTRPEVYERLGRGSRTPAAHADPVAVAG